MDNNELIKSIMEDANFDDILTMDILDEGEQADAYRARKEQEKNDNKNFGKERFTTGHGNIGYLHKDSDGHIERRYNTGNKMTKENPNNSWRHPIMRHEGKKEDSEYQKKVEDKYMKKNSDGSVHSQSWITDGNRNTSKYTGSYQRDAIARHERRHPSKESTEEFDY